MSEKKRMTVAVPLEVVANLEDEARTRQVSVGTILTERVCAPVADARHEEVQQGAVLSADVVDLAMRRVPKTKEVSARDGISALYSTSTVSEQLGIDRS